MKLERFIKKTTPLSYDYDGIIEYINDKGRTRQGEHIYIDAIDRPVAMRLLAYFLRDKTVAEQYGMDLRKGILLNGPYGCGKTTLMYLMREHFISVNKPDIRLCKRIVTDYCVEGFESMLRYGRNSFEPYSSRPKSYCFDGLGQEPVGQHYTTTLNVMADILDTRYEYFMSCGMVTHATTHMNANELGDAYTVRLRSCMRAMFNLVSFDAASKDKRC
jgi:hypothetical protein